jgi:hypothetical protein
MKVFTKWLTVPESNDTQTIEVAQLWEVRWKSRHGEYSHDVRPEVEAFASEAQAEEFATALRNAFQLVRHTSGRKVIVSKSASR